MQMIPEYINREGLRSLLGQRVTLFCCRYIYTGQLIEVDDTCVKLEDCGIVYQTGEFKDVAWKDYQKLPHKHFYVTTQSIESYGLMK